MTKLDDLDVKGVVPLGNVIEFYGGLEGKLRTEDDFEKEDRKHVCRKEYFVSINKHMQKDQNYAILPLCKEPSPDGEE